MDPDFGAFELREELGTGAMGTVYRAVQKSLKREVVLKILHRHLAKDASLVSRFSREAMGPASLSHENIVQVIDAGQRGDDWYIAMEFVEGMNLREWVDQHGTPPPEIAILLLRDLCDGLAHAHAHGIIHRDVKPANLMFTPGGVLKIADFGLAKLLEATTEMTVAGSVLGTAAYMSPEQADGREVDGRGDVFSAGVVVYELLGGKRPFQAESLSGTLRAILTVEPPLLDSVNPRVPHAVAGIIRRMLDKDLARRYPSSEDALRDLELAIEHLGIYRGRALLRDYARDPAGVTQSLERKRAVGAAPVASPTPPLLLPSDPPAGATPSQAVGTSPPAAAPPARAVPTPSQAGTVSQGSSAGAGGRARVLVAGSAALLAIAIVALLVVVGVRWFGAASHGGGRRPARASAPPARAPGGPTRVAGAVFLEIASIPAGARVTIDGSPQPLLTNARFRGVPPGEHRVDVSKDGYQTLSATVLTVAGRDTSVRFHLAAEAGAAVEEGVSANAFEWTVETVDTADDPGRFSSLAIDAQGQPHVGYLAARGQIPGRSGLGALRYASRADGAWSVESVTGSGIAGERISLALDLEDQPHVCFAGPDNRRLCYATRRGSRWDDLEAVDTQGKVGRWSALALDSRGLPHVSYFDETNGNLKYAEPQFAGRWASTVVDPSRGVGQHTSIRLDANGRPCISYFDAAGGHLKFVSLSHGRWSAETVDPRARTGWFTSLALDSRGNPRISYYDAGSGDLRYAEKAGGVWRCGPVDTAGTVGQYTSIALDREGRPHISYCDARTGQLKLAAWNGSRWTVDVVDRNGICQWSSLALGPEDQPLITYYDAARRELRLAEGVPTP